MGWSGSVMSSASSATKRWASVGVVDGVDASDGHLGVQGETDLAAGVAGFEQRDQLGAALVVEAFIGAGEQAAGTIERVGAAVAVSEGVLLHATAALIQLRVRELHQVERVHDLGRVRECVSQGLAVRAGEVQHAPADPGPPPGRAGPRSRRWGPSRCGPRRPQAAGAGR